MLSFSKIALKESAPHRWTARPTGRPGRPKIGTEIRDLIRRMSKANPLWGAPRIHGELLKLGIKISQPTVGRSGPTEPLGWIEPKWISVGNQTTEQSRSSRHSEALTAAGA
jgi:hypothetical protein